MWPRVVEAMLGCWLIFSPFIFAHPLEEPAWWITDIASGAAVIVFALASHWRPLKRIHLASAAIALWLICFGYFGTSHPAPSAMQNDIVLGLLLAMIAIVPSEASRPPESWRRHRVG